MKRVYLSGPMSGITDSNFPAFHAWAARLRADGFDVVNPAEINPGPAPQGAEAQSSAAWTARYNSCMRADLREMMDCDAIALMPGWESSKGANLELHVAHRLGMEVIHLPLQLDLVAHLRRQIAFSERTFGPGHRTQGVIDHMRKELNEVQADFDEGRSTLPEWVDVIILALDGAWRSGATPEQIAAEIVAKQAKNEGRRWPDWRTAPAGKAIEHDRTADVA